LKKLFVINDDDGMKTRSQKQPNTLNSNNPLTRKPFTKKKVKAVRKITPVKKKKRARKSEQKSGSIAKRRRESRNVSSTSDMFPTTNCRSDIPQDESEEVVWEDSAGEDWGDLVDNDSGIQEDLSMAKNPCEQKREESYQNYDILDPKKLVEIRGKEISKVCNIIFNNENTPSRDQAIALLSHYNWNTHKLTEEYFSTPQQVLKKAGAVCPSIPYRPSMRYTAECPQCYNDFNENGLFGLACGHRSCRACWRDYLEFKCKIGVAGLNSKCNHAKCPLLVPESVWAMLLPMESQKKRERWQLKAFVESQPNIKWCPGTDCPNAVYNKGGDGTEVACTCKMLFCFLCLGVAHRPVTCKWAKQWTIKCSSEAENATWILANTKRCPKCDTQIEKNQGCNHMTCSNCKHDFCWLCKGDWSVHGSATGGYYRCNRYEGRQKLGVKSDEERDSETAANALQKYLFYYKRFDNHSKAGDFAVKSLKETNERMTDLRQLKGGGFNDVSFLEFAVKTVIECRRVLQWTYAMGYYLPEGQEKNLFEHLQEMLEKNTEHLHGLSEKPLEDLVSNKMRADVNNYTRVTRKFLTNLIHGIEQGLSNNAAMVQCN